MKAVKEIVIRNIWHVFSSTGVSFSISIFSSCKVTKTMLSKQFLLDQS
jgi:hypothetical protein